MPTAYDLLAETKSSIENALARMLQVKNGASRKELPELITSASVLFLNLRQINRVILQEEDKIKSETEAAKSPLDHTTLQLHNFLYEKNHYVKAIKACKDFKSKYPDIELVPEEEFFRDAPEEMLSDPAVKLDAHRLMLQRLNFEMHQRKQLCKQRELLEARKKMLQENIANRKKFLSSLPSHLKALKKASLPVQQHLGILHTKHMKEHQLADLLSLPLYILYTQLLSHKEAFGESIDVEISGSAKEAQSLIKQQANHEAGVPRQEDHKVDEELPDEDDDSQRRRKRMKRTQERDSIGNDGVFQAHPLSVLLHIYDEQEGDRPIKLLVLRFEYLIKVNAVSASIEGQHDADKANLLANLFPEDTGLDLPSQASKLIAEGATHEDSKLSPRCYKWAQHLAGIDFLPEAPNRLSNAETSKHLSSGLAIYRQQNRVQTILKQLRSRKKAQLALKEQLGYLHKFSKPPIKFEKVQWSGPSKCQLKSWMLKTVSTDREMLNGELSLGTENGEAGREDGELPPPTAAVAVRPRDTAQVQATLDLQSGLNKLRRVSEMATVESELDSVLVFDDESDDQEPEEGNLVSAEPKKNDQAWKEYAASQYTGVIKRDEAGRTIELEAQVTIAIDYPIRPPLFRLRLLSGEADYPRKAPPLGVVDTAETPLQGEVQLKWFNELRAMEAKVNYEVLKSLPKWQEDYVLAHQIACLCFLFDAQVDGTLTSVKEERSRRGRDRRIMA